MEKLQLLEEFSSLWTSHIFPVCLKVVVNRNNFVSYCSTGQVNAYSVV